MSDEELKYYSRELRKNMTREEKHLWYDFFKALNITVNRQKIIGSYIVDFYCHRYKLVIELDGIQHTSTLISQKDSVRDAFLKERGLTVLRYTNYEVRERFDYVCSDIMQHMVGEYVSPTDVQPDTAHQ